MPVRQPAASRPARKRRPNLSRAVRLLIRDIASKLTEFSHIRAERILVVAGEARRASRATIRPMRSSSRHRDKPRVKFRGRPIYYVMTLRPLFFRNSTPEQRIETVLHELLHISSSFDGTLADDRRHSSMEEGAFEKVLRPLVKRYLARCSDEAIARLAVNGEVLVRQWLEKPAAWCKRGTRRRYTEAHTFLGPVRMITRHVRH